MPEFEDLIAAAYQSERVLGRRLARRAGLSERQALRQTLELAAGASGLPHLLAVRASERLVEAGRRAAKAGAQAGKLALKAARKRPPPTAWLAWFDGSAHPNPGKIGIGALLTGPDGQRHAISRRAGHGNSGMAEYSALIALLEAAVALQPAELIVYGDSRVVIDDARQAGRAGAKGLEAQRARASALLARLPQVTLQWIPRQQNSAADALSQGAIELADDGDCAWDAAAPIGEPE
ncbi:ribonuclease HI [Oxalobacteraceae bacterium GrIS 1.11]